MTETQQLVHHLGTLSYIGIFGVSLLANVVIPIPEEIILLALGFLAGSGKVDPFIIIAVIIAGLFTSDILMFELSRRGNKLITLFYERFFAARLADKREWIENHIEKVIFASRFLVQLRFLGPFMAGQTQKVSRRTFITYDMAALVVYVPILIWAGDYFQDRIEFIADGVGRVRNLILIVIGVLVLISISKLIRDIIFGSYVLSFSGERHEQTLVPGIYKKKKE